MDDRALVAKILGSRLLFIVERMATGHQGVFSNLAASVHQALHMTLLVVAVLCIKVLYDFLKEIRNRMRFGNGGNLKKRIKGSLQERVHKCPICLSEARYPVLTECGHIFCCSCIIRYWKQNRTSLGPCVCAVCRCSFKKFLPIRWPSPGVSDEIDDQLEKNYEEVVDYNRRYSIESTPLDIIIQDVPRLVLKLTRNFPFDEICKEIHDFRGMLFGLCGFVPKYCLYIYFSLALIDDFLLAFLGIAALIRWYRNRRNLRRNRRNRRNVGN